MIQKRLDGSVDFQRGWNDYKRGFGSLNGEFWLGLDKMNRLTKTKSRLRVELEDTKGITAYAEYDSFGVASEKALYKMSLGSYYGELMMINYSERHQTEKKSQYGKTGHINMQLILQNCCKTSCNRSNVARFTTHFQTCLAKNQVAEVCRKLLQEVEGSSTLSRFLRT